MPFIFMLVIDIRDRRTSQRSKQLDEVTAQHLEYSEAAEQETNKVVEEEQPKVLGA
jgi:hypothetical protein